MSKYSREQISQLLQKSKRKRQLSNSPACSIGSNKSNPNLPKSPNKKPKKEVADRYHELCEKYRQLLEDVKDRSHEYKLQEQELAKLRADKDRDRKQIQRLRSLIGLIKKEDYGVQVSLNMHSSAESWSSKHERSTQLEIASDGLSPKRCRSPRAAEAMMSRVSQTANDKRFNQTAYSSHRNESNVETFRKQADILSPSRTQMMSKNFYKAKADQGTGSHKLSNSPYSKLRFIRNAGE